MKWWDNAKQAAQTPLPPVSDRAASAEAMRLRSLGSTEMNRLRPILFPEDDDG